MLGIVSVGFGLILLAIAVGEDNGGTLVLEGVIGYLMAGFATPLLWGWDAAAQRRGRINPNFASRRNYSSILRVLALAGILVSVVHLLLISVPIAERISEWLYISGIVGV